MLKRYALLVLATLVPACGGSSDAGADALVGRWDLHDDDTGELEAAYAFDADGSYHYREYGEGAESHAGTYETDGGLLILDGSDQEGARLHGEVTFFADDQRFILGALLPDGEVDGPVGRWSGSVLVENEGETVIDAATSYQLEKGGAATIEARNRGQSETREGTWEAEEGEIVVSFESSGITVNVHMLLVEGAAMGSPVFERAD